VYSENNTKKTTVQCLSAIGAPFSNYMKKRKKRKMKKIRKEKEKERK
jgi:hypothetical protein